MLMRWHYIALLAPLALMFLEWRRARAGLQIVLFAAIVLASLEALADTRIRIMRNDSLVPDQQPVAGRSGAAALRPAARRLVAAAGGAAGAGRCGGGNDGRTG